MEDFINQMYKICLQCFVKQTWHAPVRTENTKYGYKNQEYEILIAQKV